MKKVLVDKERLVLWKDRYLWQQRPFYVDDDYDYDYDDDN